MSNETYEYDIAISYVGDVQSPNGDSNDLVAPTLPMTHCGKG